MSEPSTSVRSRIECRVTETADIVFSVAVSGDRPPAVEHLDCTLEGRPLSLTEVRLADGGRLHVGPAVPPGRLVLDYRASTGHGAPAAPVSAQDRIIYRRPSRYCESDRLGLSAVRLFGGLAGQRLIDAVAGWVHENTRYVVGASGPTDGAVDTFLAGQGVCRDYAHVVITMLRACGVPARMVSVYAPGLSPMDFHAVAEVALDGRWQLVDATRMAPRASMVRIATGRDAADTAFLTVNSGLVDFGSVQVGCVSHPDPGIDDPLTLVHLQG